MNKTKVGFWSPNPLSNARKKGSVYTPKFTPSLASLLATQSLHLPGTL